MFSEVSGVLTDAFDDARAPETTRILKTPMIFACQSILKAPFGPTVLVATASQTSGLDSISSDTGAPASELSSVPAATVSWPSTTLEGVNVIVPRVDPTGLGTGLPTVRLPTAVPPFEAEAVPAVP
jgi:hypothetical protein